MAGSLQEVRDAKPALLIVDDDALIADLQRLTTDPGVPLWAKQMEIFILEDMNELEAARIMLGGMLASGRLQDPGERRFLKERLDELERRLASERRRD